MSFKPGAPWALRRGDPHRLMPSNKATWAVKMFLRCFGPVWQPHTGPNLLSEFNCWTFLGLYVWVRPGVAGAEQFGLTLLVNIVGYHHHNSSSLYWVIPGNLIKGEKDHWTLLNSMKAFDLCRGFVIMEIDLTSKIQSSLRQTRSMPSHVLILSERM